MKSEEFWQQEGINHIIPAGFGEFPEGFDVKGLLKEMTGELGYSSLIDFGCGYGRLCESFDKTRYLGLDINQEAITEAKKRFESYQFSHVGQGPKCADIHLAYTVFLHMNDLELDSALTNIRCKWLIVAEILGREWRRDGTPPVYNRDLSDYVTLLRKHDLILHKHVKRPYKRYQDLPWYEGKNTDISFLVFKKCLKNPIH